MVGFVESLLVIGVHVIRRSFSSSVLLLWVVGYNCGVGESKALRPKYVLESGMSVGRRNTMARSCWPAGKSRNIT